MEQILLTYFENKELDILDQGKSDDKSGYKHHYRGVTVPYIIKYVLENKYSEQEVKDTLFRLHKEQKLRALYCGHIETVVFNSIKWTMWWNYKPDKPRYNKDGTLYECCYKYFVDHLSQEK